jgi:hypothetical protein
MLLDPLFIRVIALGFFVLFLIAAIHKLGNRMDFLAILGAYKILPPILLRPATLVIPNMEIVVAFGWLLIGVVGLTLRAVPVISAAILLMYGAAIAVNLLRGRRNIDCGCSFSSSKTEKSKGTQQISAALYCASRAITRSSRSGVCSHYKHFRLSRVSCCNHSLYFYLRCDESINC